MKDITLQALPHSCLFRQKMLFEHPSRYKTCKILFTQSGIWFAFDLFHPLCFASVPTSSHTIFSLLLGVISSQLKRKAEASSSPDSKGCLWLPNSQPWQQTPSPDFGTSIPDQGPWGARSPLQTHARPQRSCFQHLPKKHLLTRDSQVEKLLSLYSRTAQRSLSFALEQREGRTCRD